MSGCDFSHPSYILNTSNDRIIRKPDAPKASSREEDDLEQNTVMAELARFIEAKLLNDFDLITIPYGGKYETNTVGENTTEEEVFTNATSVIASKDWDTCEKLLIIIQNTSNGILGIFSRSACFTKGLSQATMLNYVKRAKESGYGILILRPNTNSFDNGSIKTPIEGSESPEIHTLGVYESMVTKAESKHIALLGFGNGAMLCKDLFLRQSVRSKEYEEPNRIKAIVTIEASKIVEVDDGGDIKVLFRDIAVNMEMNVAPKGSVLEYIRKKLSVQTVSLGLPAGVTEKENEHVSYPVAIDPVFMFLSHAQQIWDLRMKEQQTPSISKAFSETWAKENKLDPASSIIKINPNAVVEEEPLPTPPPPEKKGFFSSLFGGSSSNKSVEAAKKSNDDKLCVEDFDLLAVVGKGAFGKVMLVRKKNSNGEIYAMKVLKKVVVAAKGQVEHTKSEKEILCEIHHPYIVRLRFSFQSSDKLYLVTDYYNGGALYTHLRKSKSFTEERSKFYAAELLSALGHLHSQQIIYRDLKLENVLMDHKGHIALTDFGLSKQDIDKSGGATTFCGTAEYIAPELLKGIKYGVAADWWSFGILLFEMMNGRTPFYDKNRKLMFYRIINTGPNFPSTFSDESQDVIRGLLTVDESSRLGSGPADASEIMKSPFFKSIDFDALYRREIEPPFKPEVIDEMDTKYVPSAMLQTEAKDSFVEAPKKGENLNFGGFTYMGSGATDGLDA
jgi:serum/glucocorticoid-regulated kinase 2